MMLDIALDAAVQIDDSLNPGDVVWHFGINAELASLATTFSETGDAEYGPPVAHRTEKWAARITCTRIDPPFTIAGAKHVVGD